jgi:uncharacterized membrane protein YfcA
VDTWQLLILAVLGFFGGVLTGVAGVGGGIVFVPALVYAAKWEIQEAVAASFVIIVFSSLSGTIRNVRSADPPNWRAAALLTSTVAPASLIGVYVSSVSAPVVVQVAFAGVLLALAYPTARGGSDHSEESRKKLPPALVLLAGVGIGALSGLVGVGGGVVMVPLLVLGLGLTTKRAVSTSLAVVFFTSIVASLGYAVAGFADFFSLAPLVVGAMAGAWSGVRLRENLPDRTIRLGFAVFMVIIVLRTLASAAGMF